MRFPELTAIGEPPPKPRRRVRFRQEDEVVLVAGGDDFTAVGQVGLVRRVGVRSYNGRRILTVDVEFAPGSVTRVPAVLLARLPVPPPEEE